MKLAPIQISHNCCIGSSRTFIIAEIGSNHCGDIAVAKESIDAAKISGADAVKFQSISLKQLYHDPCDNIRDLHRKIDMAETWHATLQSYCEEAGILFFSSPTYMQAVDILESIGVRLYKIASAQVGVFPQIIDKVAALGKPTLLSTGLVTVGQMENVINSFYKHENKKYIILHCNSIYPTPSEKVCLQRMNIWRSMFQCIVGFSDHTEGIAIPLAAVAMGASVIEKHFSLSKKMNSPDAFFSLEPAEFNNMVVSIRNIESACKSCRPRNNIELEEKEFKQSIRYRLVLKRDKKAGSRFKPGDFEYMRHDEGIDCNEEKIVLNNMVLSQYTKSGELLTWNMLKGAQ
jgi:sialic acid synthase SpsE